MRKDSFGKTTIDGEASLLYGPLECNRRKEKKILLTNSFSV
jgi:hypothetical protein